MIYLALGALSVAIAILFYVIRQTNEDLFNCPKCGQYVNCGGPASNVGDDYSGLDVGTCYSCGFVLHGGSDQ